MSREYLLKIFFEKSYPIDKLTTLFSKWCGKSQILRIGSSSIMVIMGCSSGVAPEDTMAELYNQLIDSGIKVSRENIIAWSLHPDEAIRLDEDNEVDAALIGRD